MALTRADLDVMARCSDPNCPRGDGDHPVVLNPGCHPKAPMIVSYQRGQPTLVLECAVCRKLVAAIEVAEGPAA